MIWVQLKKANEITFNRYHRRIYLLILIEYRILPEVIFIYYSSPLTLWLTHIILTPRDFKVLYWLYFLHIDALVKRELLDKEY